MNATLSGLVAAVATAETNALTGKREKQTTAAFTSLTMAKLASSLAPLVASGVARLPRQAAPEAAIEIGALFGVLAGDGTDREGRATETAANTLLGKMTTWFQAQNLAVTKAEAKRRSTRIPSPRPPQMPDPIAVQASVPVARRTWLPAKKYSQQKRALPSVV
jgi:hypothetical protein